VELDAIEYDSIRSIASVSIPEFLLGSALPWMEEVGDARERVSGICGDVL
jgi:hypothetical protein